MGRCRPRRSEIRKMERILGGLQGSLQPYRALHRLAEGRGRLNPRLAPYFPERKGPSHACFRAAGQRSPEVATKLASRVSARSDFALCDYFCDLVALGSCSEAFFVLHLLASGAEPALAAPAWMELPTPYPIVDPVFHEPVGDRPCPCLVAGGDFYFFQITFALPEIATVDVLHWRQNRRWGVIAIDAHDSYGPAVGGNSVGLPLRLVRAEDLEALEFFAA